MKILLISLILSAIIFILFNKDFFKNWNKVDIYCENECGEVVEKMDTDAYYNIYIPLKLTAPLCIDCEFKERFNR